MTLHRLLPLACAALLTLTACGGDDAADDGAAGDTATATIGPAPGDSAPPIDTTAVATPGSFLDPNTATADQLQTVAGIDAALAQAIVAGRPHANMLDVDSILAPRLSEAQRDSVYTRLWKPLDPTTASREEIMLIPGVGERMAHEFEEYRPWRNSEHFRREIGKYVDPAEVARLESYTTLSPSS